MIDEAEFAVDSQLVAYVDGALSPPEREALDARLASDHTLQARLAEVAAGGRPFAEAYEVLLRNAPQERLTAAFGRARATFEAARVDKRRLATGRWLRPLAAAVAIFLAGGVAGLGFAQLLPNTQTAGEDAAAGPGAWRAVVAEYLTLYTRDTLADMPDDGSLRQAELKSVGDKLALPLSVDKVALDGLALKRSQLFHLEGRPLAQIAYLTPDDGPVAFCVIADSEGNHDLSFEERQGKNIVYWSKGGHAFMLIGKLSRSSLETLAASLAARVA
jgi:anti-sigma factor RsiW